MIRRVAIATLLLWAWALGGPGAAPARANEPAVLGVGELVPATWLEIEIDLGGGAGLLATVGDGAVDLVKGLAALPGRVAHWLSELACAGHAAPDAVRLRHWARQGFLESFGRLRASQAETTVDSSDVEVETARSTVGEAVGWSTGELGWAVRTREHVLIIEESPEQRAAEMPTLWINRGTRGRCEDQRVAVFTSTNSSISSPEASLEAPGRPTADAGDGMEITAYRGGDQRVHVLVRISGSVIFHADNRDA